jgi:hypothetical protein
MSAPQDLNARIRRMVVKYTPEKVDSLDSLLLKYRGSEIKLLEAYKSKYGPEPNELDEAPIEEVQQRIRRMLAHYMHDAPEAIDRKMPGFAGKERIVLKNMIKKLGKEPELSSAPPQPVVEQRVAKARPLPAVALEEVPPGLSKFTKHALVVRRVDKLCHNNSAKRPRVLVVTPYAVFLCTREGEVKRFALCASITTLRWTQTPSGSVYVAIVASGQADIAIACTAYAENTSNNPTDLMKIMAMAIVAASTPGSKTSQGLLKSVAPQQFAEETTFLADDEKPTEAKTYAEMAEAFVVDEEPPAARRTRANTLIAAFQRARSNTIRDTSPGDAPNGATQPVITVTEPRDIAAAKSHDVVDDQLSAIMSNTRTDSSPVHLTVPLAFWQVTGAEPPSIAPPPVTGAPVPPAAQPIAATPVQRGIETATRATSQPLQPSAAMSATADDAADGSRQDTAGSPEVRLASTMPPTFSQIGHVSPVTARVPLTPPLHTYREDRLGHRTIEQLLASPRPRTKGLPSTNRSTAGHGSAFVWRRKLLMPQIAPWPESPSRWLEETLSAEAPPGVWQHDSFDLPWRFWRDFARVQACMPPSHVADVTVDVTGIGRVHTAGQVLGQFRHAWLARFEWRLLVVQSNATLSPAAVLMVDSDSIAALARERAADGEIHVTAAAIASKQSHTFTVTSAGWFEFVHHCES